MEDTIDQNPVLLAIAQAVGCSYEQIADDWNRRDYTRSIVAIDNWKAIESQHDPLNE